MPGAGLMAPRSRALANQPRLFRLAAWTSATARARMPNRRLWHVCHVIGDVVGFAFTFVVGNADVEFGLQNQGRLRGFGGPRGLVSTARFHASWANATARACIRTFCSCLRIVDCGTPRRRHRGAARRAFPGQSDRVFNHGVRGGFPARVRPEWGPPVG